MSLRNAIRVAPHEALHKHWGAESLICTMVCTFQLCVTPLLCEDTPVHPRSSLLLAFQELRNPSRWRAEETRRHKMVKQEPLVTLEATKSSEVWCHSLLHLLRPVDQFAWGSWGGFPTTRFHTTYSNFWSTSVNGSGLVVKNCPWNLDILIPAVEFPEASSQQSSSVQMSTLLLLPSLHKWEQCTVQCMSASSNIRFC